MSTTDKPEATKPVAKPVNETIKVRHDFTPEEKLKLAESASDFRREMTRLEDELNSIKSDYKRRLIDAENGMKRDDQKFRDGFEMQDMKAIVAYDVPKRGMKTYFKPWEDESQTDDDTLRYILREEPMTPADIQRAAQRELPLTEESVPEPAEKDDDEDLNALPEGKEAH